MTRRIRQASFDVAGFTLLEALVAMALIGMILAALATITAQWLPNWNRGFARLQRNEQLAIALERLVADLAAAEFVALDRDTRQPVFDGTDVSVLFLRTVLAPNDPPGLEMVRIGQVEDKRGPVLVRARSPFWPILADDGARHAPVFSDAVALLPPSYRLTFAYAGPDRIWRKLWRHELELPRAIRLSVPDPANENAIEVSTAALVHAHIAAECIHANSLEECIQSRLKPPGTAQTTK